MQGSTGKKIAAGKAKKHLTTLLDDFNDVMGKEAESYGASPNGKRSVPGKETAKYQKKSSELEEEFISALQDLPKGTKIKTNYGTTYEVRGKDKIVINNKYGPFGARAFTVAQQLLGKRGDVIESVELQ